jgi:hypothetical protein
MVQVFYIHLRSSYVHYFIMVEATEFEIIRGHLPLHGLPAEFHENLPVGSKLLLRDTLSDRQHGDLSF